jgi:hypothetical protein
VDVVDDRHRRLQREDVRLDREDLDQLAQQVDDVRIRKRVPVLEIEAPSDWRSQKVSGVAF